MKRQEFFHEMRNATHGKYPRFFVWENVTGALSSTHGNDFRAVLEEIGQSCIPMPRKWATCGMARLPQCDIAWRVLDAQYWGVPQRRRRIFLVADFATTGRCAAEILLVEKRLPGDPQKSSSEKQNSSNGVRTGTSRPIRVIPTLLSRDYKGIANQDFPLCEKLVIPEVDYEKDI